MSDADQQGNAGRQNARPGRPSGEMMRVLAQLHQALTDPGRRAALNKDPHGTVQGYEKLPESVRSALDVMDDHELEHAGGVIQALMNEGFYQEDDFGRVAFF